MSKIGTVVQTSRSGKESAHFEWLIPEWRKWMGRERCSPNFSFPETEWWLLMEFETRGCSENRIALCRPPECDDAVHYWLGIRRADGGDEEIGSCTVDPGKRVHPSWTLNDLGTREKQFAPTGTLTILIRMRTVPQDGAKLISVQKELADLQMRHDSTVSELQMSTRQKTLLKREKKNVADELEKRKADMEKLNERQKTLEKEVSTYEQQLKESAKLCAELKQQIVELETCLNSTKKELGDLQKKHDSFLLEFKTTKREIELPNQEKKNLVEQLEERRTDTDDISVLQEHLKKLLLSADDHDVVLRVKTKEFRAHKSVLRARSPVFEAMFKHGMKESTENTVDIDDCDPDCFCQFLQYIYTGQVDDLSTTNALGLYFCGDKYEFPGLKRRCVDLLQSSLSAPLVSNVITLAVTHEEEDLLDTAMDYVTQHLEEVMETVEWQRFLLDNPIRANEVCLKAVKRRAGHMTSKNEKPE